MEIGIAMQVSRESCMGCAACMNCCPADAIKMQADEEGFLYPQVMDDKCMDCGKCSSVCPVLQRKEKNGQEPQCYAAWSKDETVRLQSTSGGVFTHLASTVLDGGGAVAGAQYKNNGLVEHSIIYHAENIGRFRQSKYIQSEIGYMPREIKNELENGRPLLFVGTPCQCAGIRSYLGKSYENLFLCDFICRGVNSPKVYLSYLSELEENYGSKVKRVWFKNKDLGWNHFGSKVIFENGEQYFADRETDPFMLGYIKSKTAFYMRKSCYQCQFKGTARPVDITLGDFWGVERVFPDIDTYQGISAVMIHTEKGKELFEKSGEGLNCRKCSTADITQNNRCVLASVDFPEHKEMFNKEFIKGSKKFSEIISEFIK